MTPLTSLTPLTPLARIALFAGIASLLTVGISAVPRGQSTPTGRSVTKLYTEMCSNCHGVDLVGGLAPTLLDDTWTFGGDDDSIAQSIRNGRPTTAMPAFGSALNEQEIRAFVIFIREARDRARRAPPAAGRAGAGGPPRVGPDGRPVFEPIAAPLTMRSELQPFTIEPVAAGLDTPWGIAWLPDGRMLVTERMGRLRIIEQGKLLPEPIAGVPPVWVKQDGGLMDVAVHPRFATNGWIYLSFSEAGTVEGSSSTRIIRARLRGTTLVDQQTLFQAPSSLYWVDNTHFGSRFLFDKQDRLFYSIGDRGHDKDAQDLASPYGKLHRVDDEGRAPADNPFVKRAGALPTIWSYGHRNQQGLAFHPVTGALWASEHGPRGGDELNRVEPGRNYGWPTITHGMNYDGTPITDLTEKSGMEQPVVQWTPSIAVCALEFYTGDRFPQWKQDLFVTALAHRELRRLRLDGDAVVHQEVLFKGLGRVRDIATGPDGYLYVALNEPNQIVRLVPASGVTSSTGGK